MSNLKTFTFSVQFQPDSNAFLIYVAGKYYATATSGTELARYLRLEKFPKEHMDEAPTPRNKDEEAITAWLQTNEATKCPTRAVGPTSAMATNLTNKPPKELTLTLEDLGI